jgi:hypothetical protein
VAATYQGDSPTQPETDEATAGAATATASNRREHVRIRPDERNRLAATLASGSDIRLIDLSRGGAQFECDRRFLPNATVSLRLLTSDGQVLVTGRVVRSRIVRQASGGLGYLVAVAFTKPLQNDLGDGGPVPSAPAPTAAAPVMAAVPPPPVTPVEAAAPAQAVAPAAPIAADPAVVPTEIQADITAEEALAFESTIELAPAMLTVTASVDSTSEQLHDMFDGNDW